MPQPRVTIPSRSEIPRRRYRRSRTGSPWSALSPESPSRVLLRGGGHGRPENWFVTLALDLSRKVRPAGGDHAPVMKDVHAVRVKMFEDARVVGDHEDTHVRAAKAHDTVGDGAQRVDVET